MKKLLISSMLWLLFTFTICIWMDYSSEFRQAYNWAYQSEITTQSSIEKANMWWKITREEMAKMISNYAINILWKSPDTTKSCLFSDSNINPDLVKFVTESCQLWLMWQWITSFKPRDFVTRAEFWTVLSRALWWDKYGWWNTYYESHLKALQYEWIMKKIDVPMDKEIRWYVMLMLMRSVNQETDYNDDQISEVIQLLD